MALCCWLEITAATLAYSTFCIQHTASKCVCVFSSCSVFDSASPPKPPALEPFWKCVREVQQAKQHQSTQSPLHGKEDSPFLANDRDCAHSRVPLVIFSGAFCGACLLSTWLFFFFFFSLFSSQWLCLWPLVAHQAWMKRSSLKLSSQTAMIVLQGRQKIASAFWSGVL